MYRTSLKSGYFLAGVALEDAVSTVSIGSIENGWMSSGLELERRNVSASRILERKSNDHAYRTMFPRLIKRMRSIATAVYMHAA